MIILALIVVFAATVLTGPAGRDAVARHKQLKSRPVAKVLPFPYPPGHPRKL